jgi:hypothetical protein
MAFLPASARLYFMKVALGFTIAAARLGITLAAAILILGLHSLTSWSRMSRLTEVSLPAAAGTKHGRRLDGLLILS